MTTRTSLVTALLCLLLHPMPAQEKAISLSMQQSCRLGTKQNADVLYTSLEQEKARYKVQEKESKLYPQLEGYSRFGYNYAIPKLIIPGEIFGQTGLMAVEIGTRFDWTGGFRATQLLYNQSYRTSLQLARSMVSVEELNHRQKKEEIIFQISQLYLLCQATRRQIVQLELALQNMEQLLGIARQQYENGIIRKVDQARISVNQNNLQTEADHLHQLYTQQLGMLKYLTGLPADTKVILTDTLSLSPSPMLPGAANMTHRTELQLLDKKMELTRLTQRMNRQSWLPTLSGFGEYYFQGQRNAFDFFRGGDDKFYQVGVVGISLQVPLFDGWEKKAKTKQFDLELRQLKNRKEQATAYYSKEYTDAVRLCESSYRAIVRQEENIRVAAETYAVSLQGYRQQLVPLSDLLLSENSLTEARLSYYNALLQLKNAELGLMKANGTLELLLTAPSPR